jgi:tripartite-type tricarboxylate transporter receptor subunit TctC
LKRAKELVVATSGIESSSGVTSIIAFDLLGVKWRPINLAGSAAAITAVLRGDADVLNFNVVSLLPFVQSGDFVPMFVTGVKERLKELPDVPTLNELGYSVGIYLADVRAIAIRPGVSKKRLDYLKKTIWQSLSDPAFHEYGKRVKRTTNVLNAEDTKKAIDALFEVFSQKKAVLKKYMIK